MFEILFEIETTKYILVLFRCWKLLTIVKYQLGKLPLQESPEVYLPKQRDRHQISSLNLDENSVTKLTRLPFLHRDPFDRMLICQAWQHNLTIATVNSAIRAYQVNCI